MKIVNNINFNIDKSLSIKTKKAILNEEQFLNKFKQPNIDNKSLSDKLDLSNVGKDIFETVYSTEEFLDSFELFSSSKDFDVKIAKDYEKRFNKIKEIVSKKPELKGKEKELVKRLDEHYDYLFKRYSNIFVDQYRHIVDFSNGAREEISKIFKTDFTRKADLDKSTKNEIKSEFVNFFKHITNEIKKGIPSSEIKGMTLENNKYLKTYSDIQGISKASAMTVEFAFNVQRRSMNYHLVKDQTEKDMFKDLQLMIYELKFKSNNLDTSDFGKQFLSSVLNMDSLMSDIRNKLFKNV